MIMMNATVDKVSVFFNEPPRVKQKYAPIVNNSHVSIPRCSNGIHIAGRLAGYCVPWKDFMNISMFQSHLVER